VTSSEKKERAKGMSNWKFFVGEYYYFIAAGERN